LDSQLSGISGLDREEVIPLVPPHVSRFVAGEWSVEDLRDNFSVPYETAAHRFTNLATDHLDVPVHFLKVHDSGVISKAYENDNVVFPTDALGSVEGQNGCRWWLYARCSRSRID
jgi:hypothetical protein